MGTGTENTENKIEKLQYLLGSSWNGLVYGMHESVGIRDCGRYETIENANNTKLLAAIRHGLFVLCMDEHPIETDRTFSIAGRDVNKVVPIAKIKSALSGSGLVTGER